MFLWFRNVSIARKLIMLVISTSIFISMVGSVGFISINSANKHLDIMYNENLLSIKSLSDN